MELRHIRYFLAVAEEQNFTRAAARVGIGQPPLSQQIRDLEVELGTPLFHRVPHGAELTEAGKAFRAEAQLVLAGAEKAKAAAQRAHRGEVGTLSLGFTGSAAFNPAVSIVIRSFRRRWPGVLLTVAEMNTPRLLDRLMLEELDAVFIRSGAEDPTDIRLTRFPDEPMLIALPSSHTLASRDWLPLSALAAEPFILIPRLVGHHLHDEIVSACRSCGFEPIAGQEAPQMASVVNLVAAGFGVSIVPTSIAQVRMTGVVYRPIEGPAPVARLALASRKHRRSAMVENLFRLLPRQ